MWTAVVVGALTVLPNGQPGVVPGDCAVESGVIRVVAVEQVVAHPDQWDCTRLRLVGVAVRGFEDYNLYATDSERCADRPRAIAVNWYKSSITEKRFARKAEIEGTFRNYYGRTLPRGEVIILNSAAGPGPLSDVRIVRWLSGDLPDCKHP